MGNLNNSFKCPANPEVLFQHCHVNAALLRCGDAKFAALLWRQLENGVHELCLNYLLQNGVHPCWCIGREQFQIPLRFRIQTFPQLRHMTGKVRVCAQMANRLNDQSAWPTCTQQVARRGAAKY